MSKKTMALRLALDDMPVEKIAKEIDATEEDVIRWLGGGGSTIKKETKSKNINVDVNARIDIKIEKRVT